MIWRAVVLPPRPGRGSGYVMCVQPVPWPEPDPQVVAAVAGVYRGRREGPLAGVGRDKLGGGAGGGEVDGGGAGGGRGAGGGGGRGASAPGGGARGVVRAVLPPPLRHPDDLVAAAGLPGPA